MSADILEGTISVRYLTIIILLQIIQSNNHSVVGRYREENRNFKRKRNIKLSTDDLTK